MDLPSDSNPLERPGIVGRPIELNFGALSTPYWYGENVLVTAFLAGLSAVFPPGEREFVRSVVYYRDKIMDPSLLADVRGFAVQEGAHSREHQRANQWLDQQGYAASEISAKGTRFNKWFVQRFSPKVHLALTVMMEHITAILAEYVLTHPEVLRRMPEVVGDMFSWHAVEEIEHKAVAFDVYMSCVGSRTLLRFVGLAATTAFAVESVASTRTALRGAPRKPNIRDRREAFRLLFGRRGVLRGIGRRYFDFFRGDFHPWDHDNRHLLRDWEATES